MKEYLTGLLFISLFLQPIFVAWLIGFNLQCIGCLTSAYSITSFCEMLIVLLLFLPYWVGVWIRKDN